MLGLLVTCTMAFGGLEYLNNGGHADAGPVVDANRPWGLAHTGQSLAQGGVDGGDVAGINPPLYPSRALMLEHGPLDTGHGALGNILIPLEEGAEVSQKLTIGTSFTRDILKKRNETAPALVSVFHGSAWGGRRYEELKKGGVTGAFEAIVAQARIIKYLIPDILYKAVSCIHGEADGLWWNDDYANDLAEWASDLDASLRNVTGQTQTVNFLFCQTTSAGGYGYNGGLDVAQKFWTPVWQLQAHVDNFSLHLVATKYFLPYHDHSHLTNAAQRTLGEYYAKALNVIESGGTWDILRPGSVTAIGDTVVIDFVGAVGDLVWDVEVVAEAVNKGFAFRDDDGGTITGASITGPAQVILQLNGVVGAGAQVGYAYHNGEGGAANQVAGLGDRGNLRDSDTATSAYSNSFLRNWCVVFRTEVQASR
jgi:hypothetical protein